MPSRYDAVVIGAGPAGSTAAYEIAAAGFTVLFLEKHARPGTPLCCAEALSRSALEDIIKPRPEWISTVIERVKCVAPSGMTAEVYHPQAGYVLDRPIFDAALADRAAAAGADLQCETIGLELQGKDEHYERLEILRPDGSREMVEAALFIAADGVESKISRLAGMDNLIGLDETEACLQYRISGIEIAPDTLEFYVGRDVAPQGYAWIFPKSETSANAGLGLAVRLEKGERTAFYLDRLLKKRFGHYTIEKKFCGLVPRHQGRKMLRRGNLLVVGDAARVIDSLSGAGIGNALLSGQIAGEAAAAFLSGKLSDIEEVGRIYPKRFWDCKGEELIMYSRLRNMYNDLSDDEFEYIFRILKDHFAGRTVTDINFIGLLTGMVLKRPRLLRLARYLV